ncbi:MAG: RDD family protein, partial [Trueperaceae bacterium]
RALAVTIDTALCAIALVGLFWLTRARPDTILFLALPLYGALRLGYHTLWEGTSGTTLGKRLARLRVVSVDGGPVGFRRAFKRNLARLLDALAFYLVALVVAAQPGKRRSQRIGDRWAGTLVVDERRIEATVAARRALA